MSKEDSSYDFPALGEKIENLFNETLKNEREGDFKEINDEYYILMEKGINNGKPSRMNPPYQSFRKLQQIYKGKGIEVLNIYGDLKDGSVSNSSARSLKYLLGNSPKIYEEKQFEGKSAQHSQLHENSKVADELIQFLWKH